MLGQYVVCGMPMYDESLQSKSKCTTIDFATCSRIREPRLAVKIVIFHNKSERRIRNKIRNDVEISAFESLAYASIQLNGLLLKWEMFILNRVM